MKKAEMVNIILFVVAMLTIGLLVKVDVIDAPKPKGNLRIHRFRNYTLQDYEKDSLKIRLFECQANMRILVEELKTEREIVKDTIK